MIFVLPGMGADHRMYHAPVWQALPSARFIDWPQHQGERSIAGLAERVITDERIQDGDTVIGSSLGGIVGCEIANRRKLGALVLVGSASAPDEIAALLRLLHPLAALAPLEFIRAAAGKLPGELCEMFASSQAAFLRAMCRAIFEWQGLAPDRIRPLRIHGKNDHVIPAPPTADLLIDGGHLIAMTHPDQCVSFIGKHLPRPVAEEPAG